MLSVTSPNSSDAAKFERRERAPEKPELYVKVKGGTPEEMPGLNISPEEAEATTAWQPRTPPPERRPSLRINAVAEFAVAGRRQPQAMSVGEGNHLFAPPSDPTSEIQLISPETAEATRAWLLGKGPHPESGAGRRPSLVIKTPPKEQVMTDEVKTGHDGSVEQSDEEAADGHQVSCCRCCCGPAEQLPAPRADAAPRDVPGGDQMLELCCARC